MKKIIFFVVILLIPVCAGAAYTIYLKNGSVISDVRSYNEAGEEISVYFQTGAMVIPRRDILRITGEETPENAAPEAAQETRRRCRDPGKMVKINLRKAGRKSRSRVSSLPVPLHRQRSPGMIGMIK